MTDIEQRARDALNEVAAEQGSGRWVDDRENSVFIEAICRLLEREDALQKQFDDFRQEVSDKVAIVLNSDTTDYLYKPWTKEHLASLVIPKSAPLAEVCKVVFDSGYRGTKGDFAQALRDELAKRGGKIVWEGGDDAS